MEELHIFEDHISYPLCSTCASNLCTVKFKNLGADGDGGNFFHLKCDDETALATFALCECSWCCYCYYDGCSMNKLQKGIILFNF